MFSYNEASYLETAIKNSLQKLKNESIVVRCKAAQELGNLENSNCPMVETALLKAMEDDESAVVRTMAAEALGKLGNPKPLVLKALVKAFKDQNDWVHLGAIDALKRLKCSAPFIVTALSKVSQTHYDSFVRNIATEALEALRVKKEEHVDKRKLCSLEKIENGNNIEKKYKPTVNLKQDAPILFSFTGQKNKHLEFGYASTAERKSPNTIGRDMDQSRFF